MHPQTPTLDELAADPVTHHDDDMIAPTGLTNFLGTVRVDHDLTAVSVMQFPPVSQGATRTAALFVDGRLFASLGVPVTHEWRPDRERRTARWDGWEVETTTVCVPGETAVAIEIRVRNTTAAERTVTLALSLSARVTVTPEGWRAAESPAAANLVEVADDRVVFRDPDGTAWSVQGLDVPARYRPSGVVSAEGFDLGIGGNGRGAEVSAQLVVPAGGQARCGYVAALATDAAAAGAMYDRVIADVPAAVVGAQRFWQEQLVAAFRADDEAFSGHLPTLETTDPVLRRLYHWAVLGVVWFRRDHAGNVLGRTYDTLMPNYWGTTTFIWDYSLSSLTHALLDPTEMRRQLLHWVDRDIHTHFGTSSLTGEPVGNWYSVNDYAMTRLVHDYIRITGDDALLDEPVGDGTVLDALHAWATAWRGRRRGSALADYGEIDNLLECVSSYTHEVASLNAANVWVMRTAAELLRLRDDPRAADLEDEAERLVPEIIDRYVPGTGYFTAGQPDGTRLPVRHCYDFSVVGTTIAAELPPRTRREMVAFFQRELQTENWMRALSPWDPDASYSVRPDHQWNGAYPAWPADAARALIDLGAAEVALDWLPGLARSANQGPMGQAHFVTEAQPSINGGARKAPPQLPYIIDWACSSSGAWVELILTGLFGLRVDAAGSVRAGGPIATRDPGAVLRDVRIGDRRVDVHADGRVSEHVPSP
ncbi:glucosidase family protein [Microbacterium gorillae]|uniref:hypothetical protein n=1 Tax=Microbacterium gorillae TaxID=1231063 RepID=UPI00058C42DF|nr:hypothetical protein [Microbacterium gorillae]